MKTKTLFQKANTLAIKAHVLIAEKVNDTRGSDSTEKVGMVFLAAVVVGLLVAAVRTFMPGFFNTIMQKAQELITGL